MRLLLDTHVLIWFLTGEPQLSVRLRQIIEDGNNKKWVSMATLWEMAIKVSMGKLTFSQPYDAFVRDQILQSGFRLLPIELRHTLRVATLSFHHRDPFDRLLIAQSLEEAMPILSVDAVFDAYGVTRLF